MLLFQIQVKTPPPLQLQIHLFPHFLVLTLRDPGGCISLLLAPSILFTFGHPFHFSLILRIVPILILHQTLLILVIYPPAVFQINSSILPLLHCHQRLLHQIKSILLIRLKLILPLKLLFLLLPPRFSDDIYLLPSNHLSPRLFQIHRNYYLLLSLLDYSHPFFLTFLLLLPSFIKASINNSPSSPPSSAPIFF